MGSLHNMNKEQFVHFIKMHIRDEASAGLIQKLEKPLEENQGPNL